MALRNELSITIDPCEKNGVKVNGDKYYLTPAEYVIFVFQGTRALGRAIGRRHQSIALWYDPKNERGSMGLIPTQMQKTILAVAKERGLDVTAEDLIYGREVKVKYG